ncbi:MAG: NADH:ubiquinone reductase (Na(+)-transporting) subunit D [Rhodothermales bacterium]|jgi:Na+-transporting NADH:ubiquinone oxidoreductase subunit D|nr:NADH:ubiquinone reductase (Na(+)-transporting) subunit D [Rhodothermales bacterium]MDG2016959.1 NADH:ubiquinone reductase (Na(+)-transporting) subunit D [Rhodothermales bacterium]
MSAESTMDKQAAVKEAFWTPKNKRLLSDPFSDDNPITIQVLGVCSALAVTTQLKTAFVMAVSVVIVLVLSNVIISTMRNSIPSRIRMIVQLLVIAGLVILVDQVLKAFAYDVSRQLSVYIGLIITNCIIMGRLEAMAMSSKPSASFLDGLGNGFGYGWILIVVSFFRELFGAGSLFGVQVMPQALYDIGYENNGIMLTSAAAMFIIGVIIWVQRARNPKLVDAS